MSDMRIVFCSTDRLPDDVKVAIEHDDLGALVYCERGSISDEGASALTRALQRFMDENCLYMGTRGNA